MHKIKYLIVCLCFFIACKSDTKQTEVSSENSTQNATESISNSASDNSSEMSASNSATEPNGTSTSANTSAAVPAADNVIAQSNTSNTTQTKNGVGQKSDGGDNKMIIGKSKMSETLTTIMADDTQYGKDASKLTIPDPCTLISVNGLNSALGITGTPEIKSGSKVPRPAERSCFFRFEDPRLANSGVMLQIMTNPQPTEIDDYPSLVIDGKIKDGEQSPQDKTPKKFKVWNELGYPGCYSYDAAKYHWRIGSKYIFLLAFNTKHTEAEQKQIALTLGKEIMKNFNAKIK
jgi:hypothetical protein